MTETSPTKGVPDNRYLCEHACKTSCAVPSRFTASCELLLRVRSRNKISNDPTGQCMPKSPMAMASSSNIGAKPAAYKHEYVWLFDKELCDQYGKPHADMIAIMTELIGRRYAQVLAKDLQAAKGVENLRAKNTERNQSPSAALATVMPPPAAECGC